MNISIQQHISKRGLFLWVLLALISGSGGLAAERRIEVGGVNFRIVEASGWFLGIGDARSADLPLQAETSIVYPLVADERAASPLVGSGLKLLAVTPADAGWDLELEIHAAADPADWQAFFLWDEASQSVLRDEFRFARTRPLAEINRAEARDAYLRARGSALQPIGRLIWQIRPHHEWIAGWHWRGWKWRIRMQLNDPVRTTAIRLIGGFELGGTLNGLSLANLRYRGLGDLEQAILTDADGRSMVTFNTQDTFARPSPLPEGFTSGNSAHFSREQATALRRNSWIHTMARGAGTGFFDYQYRAEAALLAYPERQGNLRALTEVYPGDIGIGQSSEVHFGYRAAYDEDWMCFAVLRAAEPQAAHFWRNRYLEIDRTLRNRISAELGFLQDPVLPMVGYLFDIWSSTDRFAPLLARMGDYAGYLAELGVRRVMTHNPGWENGRAARHNWDGTTADFVGGSVNTVYDWTPLPQVRQPWRNLSHVYDQLGIEHYVWISGMSQAGAAFALEVGENPAHWALNSPDGPPNETYGVERLKHNILSPRFRAVWDQRFDDLRRDYGFAGYWGDSFQNLMMSQLNWAAGAGEPQQRAWWEWLALQSHRGRGWISESHSFPGLSCSIETENWDQQPWMLGQVVRWLRGTEQTTRSPQQWSRLLFRLMAFDAWLAPEIWPYYAHREVDPAAVIADFQRLAQSFNAARPALQQPWILPDDAGVLWTAEDYPQRGVLFPFKRLRLPAGVLAHPILDYSGHWGDIAPEGEVMILKGRDIGSALGVVMPPVAAALQRLQLRPYQPNLLTPAQMLQWAQAPGSLAAPVWQSGGSDWRDAEGHESEWPQSGARMARFAAGTRTFIEVAGTVRCDGILTSTPGVGLVINTVEERQPGSLLEVSGPMAGPLDIYFRGTLRGHAGIYGLEREQAGLRLRGGAAIALQANLLPWPGDYHRHSQLVSLTDPGTTVHFRGQWPATGELNRPGLTLDAGTRFMVWPQAELPFIKNYGGFTLQWWVGRGRDGGGILEFHVDFVADRSREQVSPFTPDARNLRTAALGSVRLQGVTLITHDSRNLPITGRAQDAATGSIQNNGHLVFEYPEGGRWEVRTRPQTYRGAVWLDADTTIVTGRDLTLLGVTEAADNRFGYVAANAFQTRKARGSDGRGITIRKEGPARLVLAGEQAYVAGTRMEIHAGTVVLQSNPATGGMFPVGKPADAAHLQVQAMSGGSMVFATEQVQLAALLAESGSELLWTQPATVRISGPAQLSGSIRVELPAGEYLLLEADRIDGSPQWLGDPAASMRIQKSDNSDQLIIQIP